MKIMVNGLVGFGASLGLILGTAAGTPSGDAFGALKQGDARFASGASQHPRAGLDRVSETGANGQAPMVTILGCSDSRVPWGGSSTRAWATSSPSAWPATSRTPTRSGRPIEENVIQGMRGVLTRSEEIRGLV